MKLGMTKKKTAPVCTRRRLCPDVLPRYAAERALDTMNFTTIKDQACRIMWSQRDPSLRRSGVGNIFVKNLDETVDNKVLQQAVRAYFATTPY